MLIPICMGFNRVPLITLNSTPLLYILDIMNLFLNDGICPISFKHVSNTQETLTRFRCNH